MEKRRELRDRFLSWIVGDSVGWRDLVRDSWWVRKRKDPGYLYSSLGMNLLGKETDDRDIARSPSTPVPVSHE